MNRIIALSGVFAVGWWWVAIDRVSPCSGSAAQRSRFTTDLNNLPGQEIIVFASTWQPGFRLPLHMHPNGHEITYVVDGEQTFEIEGIGTKVVKAGEAIYTPPNTPHFGRNATDKISTTVVIRVKDKDKPITVEIKK